MNVLSSHQRLKLSLDERKPACCVGVATGLVISPRDLNGTGYMGSARVTLAEEYKRNLEFLCFPPVIFLSPHPNNFYNFKV